MEGKRFSEGQIIGVLKERGDRSRQGGVTFPFAAFRVCPRPFGGSMAWFMVEPLTFPIWDIIGKVSKRCPCAPKSQLD